MVEALLRQEGSTRALWALLWAIVNTMDRRERRSATKVAEIVLGEVRDWLPEELPSEIDPITVQASVEQLEEALKKFRELEASQPGLFETFFRQAMQPAKASADSDAVKSGM